VHLTLADRDGRAFGGHAAPGCVVFACELVLSELHGPSLERAHDETTGLPLWRGL
jgi:predicted DNA-binding protein with PD1-like motif